MYPAYPFRHSSTVLVKGNKAVNRCDGRHLCGYVTFEQEIIPTEWHGSYTADGLQYLAIHGGLTFCEVGGGDDVARAEAARFAMERGEDDRVATCSVPYQYVTFGFDCGHAGDDERPELKDPIYVMRLVADMERLLMVYRGRLPEWRAESRERRIEIIDEINQLAEIKCALGFGALIGILGGNRAFGEPLPRQRLLDLGESS